jgi:type IV pilus assembly protein PilM
MALPFLDGGSKKKRDQIVAVDLGGRSSKAVHLVRRNDGFMLTRYAVLDAPIFEKALSPDLLTEHLRQINQALESKSKSVALTVGINEAVVRHVDMPRMPIEDMRPALRLNSRNYLQQDLSNFVFDCHVSDKPADPAKAASPQGKQRILVAGVKRQLADDYTEAAKNAGLMAECIVPGLICPVNAFESSQPEVFSKETIALVDVGFKCSSICIVQEGELILSRVVGIGGDRLTTAISESMSISYPEAEGIKVGMAHEVQAALDSALTPLGRELRASVDYYEHQHDRPVTRAFITGGSARSDLILQSLQAELQVECKTWNPAANLKLALASDQSNELEGIAPQLAVALGAALSAF